MKITRTVFALSMISVVSAFAFVSRSALSTSVKTTTSPSTARTLGIRMMSSTLSPMDFAKSEIEGNKVVVFSKSYCPFCTKTKTLFTDKGVDFKVHELNKMDEGDDIRDALLEMTGQKTFPNVFINGQHVGGNSETQDAESSGKLDELLAQ